MTTGLNRYEARGTIIAIPDRNYIKVKLENIISSSPLCIIDVDIRNLTIARQAIANGHKVSLFIENGRIVDATSHQIEKEEIAAYTQWLEIAVARQLGPASSEIMMKLRKKWLELSKPMPWWDPEDYGCEDCNCGACDDA